MSGCDAPARPEPQAALDYSSCEQEPIHVPGAIQPNGAVIAALADSLLVTHASANLAAFLGRQAEAVLGKPLAQAIGDAACHALQASGALDWTAPGALPVVAAPDGTDLTFHAYRSGRHICIDIEPHGDALPAASPATLVRSVLETFRHAGTRQELCDLAVRGLKALVGYDRVIAYRFHSDGHGEVIAEAREDRLEPYLGLHYPASDIPPQARALYLRQRVGAVASSSYVPVPLLADAGLDDGTKLDLTHSALRSISPVHLEYMRNMNTAASLTIALPHGPELWGMLVCHHTTPRTAGPEQRAIAEMIGQITSLLLSSLGDAEYASQRLARTITLKHLTQKIAAPMPLPQAMEAAAPDLLALVDATGALVRIGGSVLALGVTPPLEAADQALAVLRSAANGEDVAIDDLGLRHPELAACAAAGSGALLLPLGPGSDDAILWFRPELSQTLAWGGNPNFPARVEPETGRISPRTSFATWISTANGRSAPWTEADISLAREAGRAIEAELVYRIKAELARLRDYDVLTGLPNRNLLEDWLLQASREAHGVARGEARREARGAARSDDALLFLDLDRFKVVNDTMGHAAGDALLVEAARRMVAAAEPDNRVARLGGDEFVVFCRAADPAATSRLAERIRTAVEAPFEIGGRSCYVSISIGIAYSGDVAGLDLVRAADMAMYVAKQCGGNRAVVFEASLYERAVRQFELDRDMRQALSVGDEFVLVYQPVFSVSPGGRRLAGFEALLRWRHPRQGWLAPDLFIPLAEKSGLIQPLGDWVLTEACRQGRIFQAARPDLTLQMAVNVSASQLARPGFAADVAGVLQAETFPPEALCLEVTESMVTDVAVSCVLVELRALGVKVAIDDFGVGYSSLSYLLRLPADVVKLDRSFLEMAGGSTRGPDFVGAVVALAHVAGKVVLVEGIENASQLEMAIAMGADMLQGFLLARPLSVQAAEEAFLRRRD
nr:EAL domain-containing protein [uncultured Rhodopila sp.]